LRQRDRGLGGPPAPRCERACGEYHRPKRRAWRPCECLNRSRCGGMARLERNRVRPFHTTGAADRITLAASGRRACSSGRLSPLCMIEENLLGITRGKKA
jgi:hypothetical protein